jgi:hypothetical protein
MTKSEMVAHGCLIQIIKYITLLLLEDLIPYLGHVFQKVRYYAWTAMKI